MDFERQKHILCGIKWEEEIYFDPNSTVNINVNKANTTVIKFIHSLTVKSPFTLASPKRPPNVFSALNTSSSSLPPYTLELNKCCSTL